jgi:predicted dehydrogenase
MTKPITRRNFLATAAAGAALSMTASSYARIIGANEKISIGIIGCGSRGYNVYLPTIHGHAATENVQVNAICDPWRQRREEAAARIKELFNCDARLFVSYRDLLALKDIDAVMIASCDHQHTTHLEAAVKAGKDVYCEKPLAKDFNKLCKAYDAVKRSNSVVQIGTQLRSYATFTGCQKLYQTGILGTVGRIEQRRNTTQPYWYGYIRDVEEKDVDWKEFLMDLPMRPFDPVAYSGWYGYRETSDGPVPGLASHFIDLVHYITGAKFPTSCVSLGGTYTWKDKYNFTCPDHVQALWEYPEGFMVVYSTNFGNGGDNSFKILGDQGLMDMTNWSAPVITAEGGSKNRGIIRGIKPVEEIARPDHWLDWLQCLRTRKTPNASIEAGFQHAVACIMAVQAMDTGRRLIYDPQKRQIRHG